MNKFKILVRKFGPFEIIARQFWEQYKQKYASELSLDLVTLDLPELHDAILEGEYDIAQVNTDWLAQCHKQNTLADLSSYILSDPPEDYPRDWAPALLGLQTFGKDVLGVPFHDGPECMIYRKDLFQDPKEKTAYKKKYKAELRPPETWEEFYRASEFFNRPEKNIYGTVFALFPDGHNNIFDFGLQVWSRGGSLTDKTGKPLVYSHESVLAMEFYRSLLNQPFVHPESKNFDSFGSCWAFAKGEVALMVNWFGFASVCETDKDSKVRGCVDITSIPHAKGFDECVSLNVYYTWSISNKSRNKKAAYDYILNATTKENDIELTLKGAIGCRKTTWFDPGINKLIPYYNKIDEIHRNARTLPRVPNWHNVSKIIDRLVLDVMNTDIPVEKILKQAQIDIDQLQT
jgi:multiple sugar transport system substrate-binding protein